MAYTREDARIEVGTSTDWAIGLEASIKKWEQRAGGDTYSYSISEDCGLCFVADNRGLPHACCTDCPCLICSLIDAYYSAEDILHYLRGLREEVRTDE